MKHSVYAQRVLKGVCTRCGARPPERRTRLCQPCLDYWHEWRRRPGSADSLRESNRKWMDKDRVAFLDRHRQTCAKARAKRKALIVSRYGGKCACCGEKEPAFLLVDHINENGSEDREMFDGKKKRGGDVFYRRVIALEYPDHLQLLCYNCHAAKNIQGGCPHKFKHTRTLSPPGGPRRSHRAGPSPA